MKEKTPLVIKLETETAERLIKCAERVGIKKYSLAIMALEAAVDAIEKNDYKIVAPIKFNVTHVAVPKEEAAESRAQAIMDEISERELNLGSSSPAAASYKGPGHGSTPPPGPTGPQSPEAVPPSSRKPASGRTASRRTGRTSRHTT